MAITSKPKISREKASELILTQGFSGSYQPEQVTFLLKRTQIRPTDILATAQHQNTFIRLYRQPNMRATVLNG